MKSACILGKVSICYWKKHKMRLFVLLLTMALGAAALFSAAALMVSYKDETLSHELNLLGDYDLILYDLEENVAGEICRMDGVEAAGVYSELAYASVNGYSSPRKVACFDDFESQEIYHMNCMEGRYPVEEDEIAMDIHTAKLLGIHPELGEKVCFTLSGISSDKTEACEFTIVGLFEASNEMVLGGWYRYPVWKAVDAYDMPAVFVSSSWKEQFINSKKVVFLQTLVDDLYVLEKNIADTYGISPDQMETPNGRRFAYSYILGIIDTIFQQYGGMNPTSILAAIKDQNTIKDFYSAVFIPLFGLLISAIAFLSIYGTVTEIVNDKREQMATIRCIGLDAKTTGTYMLIDFSVIAGIGTMFGLLLGTGVHLMMIRVLNTLFRMHLVDAFHANPYVHSVTSNPFFYPLFISMLTFLIACLWTLKKVVMDTPATLFQKGRRNGVTKHRRRIFITEWKRLLKDRLGILDKGVLAIAGIVMGAVMLGYVYFSALADLNSSELEYQRYARGLTEYDYVAEKAYGTQMYTFQIENGHRYGIPQKCYEDIINHPYVQNSEAQILNRSTRLAYVNLDSDKQALLGDCSLRMSGNTQTEYEKELKKAEDAMISDIGYRVEEEIYSVPSIGMDEKTLKALEAYVVDGEMHPEKIRDGSEVILIVSERDAVDIGKCFQAGEELPLSDILLSEEEEQYDFSRINPHEVKEPVYRKNIKTEDGYEVPLTSFSFGRRKNIETRIGAVAVVDEQFAARHLPKRSEYLSGVGSQDGYGIYIGCCPETFESWGLPDQNYTRIRVKAVSENFISEMDRNWYGSLSAAEGLSISSGKEIYDSIAKIRSRNMCICFMMICLLSVLGAVASAIAMYSRIRLKSREIAYLSAVGLTKGRICRVILEEHMLYPVVGLSLSILPVALCQFFFLFIRYMVDHKIWGGYLGVPWYSEVPFRCDLYRYHPARLMLVIFLVYSVVILLATIPSLLYVKRQRIVDNLERNEY